MNLQDIFDHLVYGELHTVALGKVINGEIPEENKKRLLTHINAGLDAIFGRFNLREERLKLLLTPEKTRYVISPRHAISNPAGAPERYIDDTSVPFDYKFYKLLNVHDKQDNSLLTATVQPRYNIIELPEAVTLSDEYLTLTCRAGHRRLTEIDLAIPSEFVDVELPYSHLEALGYFIASRVMNPIGMQDEMGQGINYSMKFEAACRVLEDQGFQLDLNLEHTRAERGGWM